MLVDGYCSLCYAECDDANFINTDACLTSCQSATCGDGLVHAGSEICDDANFNNHDGCTTECQPCGSSDFGAEGTAFDTTTGTCFVAVPGLWTFEEAEWWCQELGGHLPHISNLVNHNIFVGFLELLWREHGTPEYGAWIGLRVIDEETVHLRWTDGAPFAEGISFQAWAFADVENVYVAHGAGEGSCNAMFGELFWEITDCEVQGMLTCQLPQSAW